MPTIDPDDVDERLAAMADEPAAVTSDGQSATNQPIPVVIELHHHAATVDALSGTNQKGGPVSGWGGIRFARAKPGGPTD